MAMLKTNSLTLLALSISLASVALAVEISSQDPATGDDPIVKIIQSFKADTVELKELEKTIDAYAVEAQLKNLKISDPEARGAWIQYWDTVRKNFGQIGRLYTYFLEFVVKPEDSLKNGLHKFVTSLAIPVEKNTLQDMLTSLHMAVIQKNSTIFSTLETIFSENEENLCLIQSHYQLVCDLYAILILAKIKGYTMLRFSYQILQQTNKGDDYASAVEAVNKNFQKELSEELKRIQDTMPSLSRIFRHCDPETHVEGETYLKVNGFLQGYIENEADLNAGRSCKSECSAYTYTESKGCLTDTFCKEQRRCKGKIFDCETYDSHATVCMSQNPTRRYDWIQYSGGTSLGQVTEKCLNKTEVNSWWRFPYYCTYCMCKCDDMSETSERYWSLLPALADVQADFIVTGVRFVKVDRIFHLQIQQAKALPRGEIDKATKTWVEPETISKDNITINPKVFTMSYEQRAMDLDSLSAPNSHVLTGMKLRNFGGHLNLEIQVTPINFKNGKLSKEKSIWIGNDNTPASPKPRELLSILNPGIPTSLKGHNKVDGEHDQYIQFDTTSAYKDVAQTTIPFIDAQPVTVQPATWIAGAGIYHKGRIGFGGFVGLSLETFDYTRHFVEYASALHKAKEET